MLRPKHRQRKGETQIAQGDDFIQATSIGDIAFRSPDRNRQEHNTGTAHGERRARELKEGKENG